ASVPAWLVSDENKYEISTEGEQYQLDDDTVVRLMIRGNKDLRTGITTKWATLSDLVTNKKYGDVAALLRDASPVVATKDVLVISYAHERMVKRNNVKDNQAAIRDLINKLTGLDLFIYAISNSEKVRLIMQYTNLRQIGRLPDPKELDNINFKEMK
ncbi:MAG: hypothetical protein MJ248_07300, partial [Bacilli bacterium]|nr:hypothetical protein [Bacilli bacterium]